ncbi:MAG: hypothetical protein V3S69_06440 [Dehalococcoidales bacterium]
MDTLRECNKRDYSESASTTAFNQGIAPILGALSLMLYSEHSANRKASMVCTTMLGHNLGYAYKLAYEAYDLHQHATLLADAAMLALESIDAVLEETGTLEDLGAVTVNGD